MKNYQADSVEFVREYQKRAIKLHVHNMGWAQRLRAAYYFFGDSKENLGHYMAERIGGNQHAVNEFLRRFPMSSRTQLEISRAMIHETMDPIRYVRR